MIPNIIRQLDFNLAYLKKSVEDVADSQMAIKPAAGLDNHPAFTLGHLVTAYANLMNNLTGEYILAGGFKEIFLRNGPGDPTLPNPDAAAYPSKEIMLAELNNQHQRLVNYLMQFDENKLNENFEWRFSSYLPTYQDRIMFLCVNHYAMHLGQLAAWRRAMDLPSALAAL